MRQIQQHHSLTAGNRPTTIVEGLYEGSLWINFPDMQMGSVDDNNVVKDFLPLRFFSPTANYAQGDLVVNNAKFWRAIAAITAGPWDVTEWIEAGGSGSNATFRTVQDFTGLAVGTTDLTWTHDQAQCELYMNGARLVQGQDYTTDGTKFTLTVPVASTTDIFEGVSYQTTLIANAITQIAADARYARANAVSVSPFLAATAYNQDDLVSYQGGIYVAKGAVTPGPWNPGDWKKASGGGATVGTAPAGPETGQLWFDDINGILFVWNGATWVDSNPAASLSAMSVVGTAAPATPKAGDFWLDTSTNELKVYDGTNWKPGKLDVAFDTAADLRAATFVIRPDTVITLGANTKGDGGGGQWYWDGVSTDADNLGTVVKETATATGRWKRPITDEVNIAWFGAVTGVADAGPAINAAVAVAESYTPPLSGTEYYPSPVKVVGSGVLPLSTAIIVKCNCDFSDLTLNLTAEIPIAFKVAPGTPNSNFNYEIRTPNLNGLHDRDPWPANAGIAVQIQDIYSGDFYIGEINKFLTGLELIASNGVGVSYNTLYLATINKCKIGQHLVAAGNGWVNDNIFIGGRTRQNFPGTAADKTAPGSIGIHIDGDFNNNVWHKHCVEGAYVENALFCSGRGNKFYDVRFEANKQITFDGAAAVNNRLQNCYLSDGTNIVNSAGAFGNTVKSNYYNVEYASGTTKYSTSSVHSFGRWNSSYANGDLFGVYGSSNILDEPDSYVLKINELASAAGGVFIKRTDRTVPAIHLDPSSHQIAFGQGTVTPDTIIKRGTTQRFDFTASLCPEADDVRVLGNAGLRWKDVYVASGAISASDRRLKQQERPLNVAEQAVAVKLKGMIRMFKMNDAVAEKGTGARLHCGVIAQEVEQVFTDEGLTAKDYGLFCYDEWDAETDEEGTETLAKGNRYSIRYDELLAFIISAI